MISFVPFAFSIQNNLPKEFPKLVFSVMEISFFTVPAALFQFSFWSDEEGWGVGGDLCYLSLVYDAWLSRKGNVDDE